MVEIPDVDPEEITRWVVVAERVIKFFRTLFVGTRSKKLAHNSEKDDKEFREALKQLEEKLTSKFASLERDLAEVRHLASKEPLSASEREKLEVHATMFDATTQGLMDDLEPSLFGYDEDAVREIQRRLERKEWPWTLRATEAVLSDQTFGAAGSPPKHPTVGIAADVNESLDSLIGLLEDSYMDGLSQQYISTLFRYFAKSYRAGIKLWGDSLFDSVAEICAGRGEKLEGPKLEMLKRLCQKWDEWRYALENIEKY